jgi:hypothetical protein
MTAVFHREYLVHLPLPQLYNQAHNDKSPRSRHDNAFYLFEALVKLIGTPLIAVSLLEVRHGGERVDRIDRDLEKLALPSLGQWLGIVRFGSDGNLRLHTEHGYAKATFGSLCPGHSSHSGRLSSRWRT